MVLAHALSRAQHYTEAVEVLDRAASALDPGHAELALQLEAAAVLPALNDPVTAPSAPLRRERFRERAASDPASPPEVLASAAFVSILTNEPAETGADLATRALLAHDSAGPLSESRPWFSFAAWFSHATFALLLAERYAQLLPLLDASIAEARVTGDGGRLAVGLRDRGWLALRRGDLSAAEGDARTALAASDLPAPPMYRVMNGTLLIKVLVDQGKLDDAEQALMPLDPEADSGFATAWGLRFARGRLRVAQGRVAEGLRGPPRPWRRSDASDRHLPELPPLALGGGARPTRARRSRVSRAPRRRGARARPGIRRPACAGRGEACRRRRGRGRPWGASAP